MDYLDMVMMMEGYRLTESMDGLRSWFEGKIREVQNRLSDSVTKVRNALATAKKVANGEASAKLKVDVKLTIDGKTEVIGKKGSSKASAITKIKSRISSKLSSLRSSCKQATSICKVAINLIKAARTVKKLEKVNEITSKKEKVLEIITVIGRIAGALAACISLYKAITK